MRNRRVRRGQERGRHHPRGTQAARVPRLRLGGRRRCIGARRPAGPARGRALKNLEALLRERPLGGHHRHRPHALGHPRPAHRRERAPPHRRLGRRSSWCTTASSRTTCDQGAPAGRGPRLQVGDRHRGHRAPDRAAPQGRRPRSTRRCARALRELRGSYAVGVLPRAAPDRLVAAKHGAGSVVVGLGEARSSSPPTSRPSWPTRATW